MILDPETDEVTHIVISKGLLFTTKKVVAIDAIDQAIKDKLVLGGPKHDLDNFQDFEETHYVDLNQTESPNSRELPSSYWYPPTDFAWWRAGNPGMPMPYYYPVIPIYLPGTKKSIPKGTVALEEGTKVISSDGKHIGNLKQVIVDSQDNRVTHFVINEGVPFRERKLVPVTWISQIDEDEIRLSVPVSVLDRLPEYQAER